MVAGTFGIIFPRLFVESLLAMCVGRCFETDTPI